MEHCLTISKTPVTFVSPALTFKSISFCPQRVFTCLEQLSQLSSYYLHEQHDLFGLYTGKTVSLLSVKIKCYVLLNCISCLKREFKSSEICQIVPAVVVR